MDIDENNEVNEVELIPGVRSLHSRAASFINFKNTTNSNVEVIWLSYQGLPVVYATLAPFSHLKLKTFETHPWVFREKRTLEKLQVNGQDIFMPTAFRARVSKSQHPICGSVSPAFAAQKIHYPLYNLRERSSQVILQTLKDLNSIFQLDIPQSLKCYLAKCNFKH